MKVISWLGSLFAVPVLLSVVLLNAAHAATPPTAHHTTTEISLGSGATKDGSIKFVVAALAPAPQSANADSSAILNRIISVRVQGKHLQAGSPPPQVKLLSLAARMPAHAHGMLVKPASPRQISELDWQVDGVKLHMAGHWVVSLTCLVNGKEEVVNLDVGIAAFPGEALHAKHS